MIVWMAAVLPRHPRSVPPKVWATPVVTPWSWGVGPPFKGCRQERHHAAVAARTAPHSQTQQRHACLIQWARKCCVCTRSLRCVRA